MNCHGTTIRASSVQQVFGGDGMPHPGSPASGGRAGSEGAVRRRHRKRYRRKDETPPRPDRRRQALFSMGQYRAWHRLPKDRYRGVWAECEPPVCGRGVDFAVTIAQQVAPALCDPRLYRPRRQTAGTEIGRGKGRHPFPAGKSGSSHGPPDRISGQRCAKGRKRMTWLPVLLTLGMSAVAADNPPSTAALEENSLKQLLQVRRVYVDHLTGGETAAQMRDILLSSLEGSKLFVLTENQERADATLKGAAEDLVFTEVHSSSDSINARTNIGTGRSSSTSRGANAGLGVGESESDHSAERRHEAVAAKTRCSSRGESRFWPAR